MYTPAEKKAIDKALKIIAEKSATYGVQLNNPTDVANMFMLRIGNLEREAMEVAFLNAQHQLITVETMFLGTIDSASVYPREIAKKALELNASAIILAHNHPSGLPEPSEADKRITWKIRDSLALLDIRTLDHIIVGGTNHRSFAELGLM